MCTFPIRKEEFMSDAVHEQQLRELRINGALKAFEHIKGVDDALDRAYEAENWPQARQRLTEIEQEQKRAGSATLLGDKNVAMLRFSVPILLATLDGL